MRILRISFLLLVFCFSLPAVAEWQHVGAGIEYRKYSLPDPNNVFVARMARDNTSAILESSLPQGKLTGAREIIRTQADRLDDAINSWGGMWGQRNDVVIAINGDWIYPNGLMYGGQVHSGWYAKRFYCEFGGSQFAWTRERVPLVTNGIEQGGQELTITYVSSGVTQQAHDVNRVRNADELIVYTPQYDGTTRTDDSGVEVLVKMSSPAGLISPPGMAVGRVREIARGRGSTSIPFDGVVLSAHGSSAETLLANVYLGAEIGISKEVRLQGLDWSCAYAAVSGGRMVVVDGKVVDNSNDHVYASRHPRTAVAYNDSYIFFVVCDGRSSESRGMSSMELGDFIVNTLEGVHAMMLDGGGSSTMVVRGSVVNAPSGGTERAVGNGLMMVNLKPKQQSSKFSSGQRVVISAESNIRLGPGTNYAAVRSLDASLVGRVSHHPLNGVYAKGEPWWNIIFGKNSGWVSEQHLTAR